MPGAADSEIVRFRLIRLLFRPHMADKKFNALPGFGLTVGYTIFYLSALVLIPLAGLFLRALEMSWADLWKLATTERALAAYRLTFGASCVAALVNAVFGT